ncbi:hypothetical protein M0G43_14350 [Subsaxibacter sp. CAU 1640]|uniref:lipocalin family protein n=1 Tax=Subsaxibacter sp. CAU 1640 TaxID=2933271 RepID=UPI0020050D5D|nr:lipocalin family protein [Subsaxibacter sp. CAU 1640]MCK7591767.1 hypothetical protein [Subsaxibacter sp. CAU 1640]
MKKIIALLLLMVVFGCADNLEDNISYMNGYWEIKEVTLADCSKREYTFSETIDFFEVNDSLIGFRKKMKPNFDGTFSTSENAEALQIKIENDSLNIYYSTPYSKWKETILDVSEDQIVIQNQAKLRYTYKRYEPLELN